MKNRQTFALIFLVVASVSCTSCSSKREATERMRPNILVMIADDWSYPHASAYGGIPIETTTFDRVAREGVLFTNAFCNAPSCTASRAALLTGMYPHQLEEGVNLWGSLPIKFPTYASVLSGHGYRVGHEQKGWGPGNFRAGGYDHNPAGFTYENFAAFYDSLKEGQPFCYWFGSHDPHRPYEKGSGIAAGLDPHAVTVPGFLPDVPEGRSDLLDYYFEVKRFDTDCGKILSFLDSVGQLDNTMVIITSDNGMPFPRAKAGAYDGGSKVPLAIRWKGFESGQVVDGFVSLIDIAPTVLSIALDTSLTTMAGRNLAPYVSKKEVFASDKVFLERERHAYVRRDNLGYPMRAIRTRNFLYINNLEPDRWPAGDPEAIYSVGAFGDIDNSPTKSFLIDHRKTTMVEQEMTMNKLDFSDLAALAIEKRPAEELYDLSSDPYQLMNIIGNERYADSLAQLRLQLIQWRQATEDPRLTGGGEQIDHYPYYGNKSMDPVKK